MSFFENIHFQWFFMGNEAFVAYLQRAIVKQNFSHAYLFCGPNGIGKETIAWHFVQSVLCSSVMFSTTKPFQSQGKTPILIPCGQCFHCKQVEKGIHPDVFLLQRELDTRAKKAKMRKNITVEQVRVFREQLTLATFFDSYKFAIIRSAELLTIGAANALLKTLEEPRRRVILLLLVENEEQLPTTLLSRCQILRMKRVPTSVLYDFLREHDVAREKALILAHLAHGLPGRMIRLKDDPMAFSVHQQEIQSLFELFDGDMVSQFQHIEQLIPVKDTADHQEALIGLCKHLESWMGVLRDMLLIRGIDGVESREYVENVWCWDRLRAIADRFETANLISLLQSLLTARLKIQENVSPKILLDHFCLALHDETSEKVVK